MINTPQPQVLLPGQYDAPEGPVDLTSMYVMHHAFRRDLTAFRAATEVADLTDRIRWRALDRRWQIFASALHHHHEAEDAGLWPLLYERVAAAGDYDASEVLDAMQAEHARIDPLLAECTGGFANLASQADEDTRRRLHNSLREAWVLLDGHLGHEERDAMALVQRHLAQSDWLAVERDHFRPAYSVRQLLTVLPWSMVGLPPDVQRRALSAGGPVVALLWRASRPSFARLDAAAFGSVRPTVVDTRSTVAIVGSTGTMGGLVLDALVARHADVRVLVRKELPAGTFAPGVTQMVADLHDEKAITAALTGVRAAFYISPHDADEKTLAANFVRAAEAENTRIVFAGVHMPARTLVQRLQLKITERFLPSYRGKLRIGQRIARSNTNPVIYSPTNFFQNDEMFEADILAGQYPLPMRLVNRVDVRDLAELCARALLDPSYPAGEHAIAGPESLSGNECAQIWARALDRSVRYVGNDEKAWVAIFQQRLHGQKLLDLISTSRFLARRAVVVPKAVTLTTDLLGRPPRNYHDYVAEHAGRLARKAA